MLSGSQHNVENESGKCSDNDNGQGNQHPVYTPLIYKEEEKKRGGVMIAILGLVVGNSNLRFDVIIDDQ